MCSAILTIFQAQQAASDPVTRTAAFLSLICALMSLSYGCMYIVRFGTMRSMFKASRWAEVRRPSLSCFVSPAKQDICRKLVKHIRLYGGTSGSSSQCQPSGYLGLCSSSLPRSSHSSGARDRLTIQVNGPVSRLLKSLVHESQSARCSCWV